MRALRLLACGAALGGWPTPSPHDPFRGCPTLVAPAFGATGWEGLSGSATRSVAPMRFVAPRNPLRFDLYRSLASRGVMLEAAPSNPPVPLP